MLGTHNRRLWNMGLRFRGDDGNNDGEPIRRIWSDMTETSARPAAAIYRGMYRAALDAAYNNSAAVADSADWLARRRAMSNPAKTSPHPPLPIPHGKPPRPRLRYL